MSSNDSVPGRCSQCNNLRDLNKRRWIYKINKDCTFCCFIETLSRHFMKAQQEQEYGLEHRSAEIIGISITQKAGQPIDAMAVYRYHGTNHTAHQERIKTTHNGVVFAIFSGPQPLASLPSLPVPPPSKVQSNVDSAAAFVSEKTKHCSTEHSSWVCTTAGDPRPMPKRVLSIGSLESPTMKLVQDPAYCGRYATLSYCWGGTASILLTKASLAGMLDGISEDELPVLFQDAVTLARKLDIDHIWIDSLCILQDSAEDWELESSKMGRYFNLSTLTISAASSPNPHVSLFEPRPSYWIQDAYFKFGTEDVVARPVTSELDLTQRGSVFSRAWTFQEIVLSRRVIHFTPQGLAWECVYGWSSTFHVAGNSSMCSLSLQHMILQSEGEGGRQAPSLTQAGQESQKKEDVPNSPSTAHFESWRKWIEHYSDRALTYETDKLPALSGIASIFADATKSRYLAGLWENQLPVALLWNRFAVDRDFTRVDSPRNYVAPSWSWASITSRVYWGVDTPHLFQASITILDISCELASLNPFGTVRSDSFMVIRGKVTRVCVVQHDRWGNVLSGLGGKDWSVMVDTALEHNNGELYRDGGAVRSSEEHHEPSAMAWAIYVGSTQFDELGKRLEESNFRHYALLLGPSRAERGSHCRLGRLNSLPKPQGDPMKLFEGAEEQTLKIL